MTTWFCASIQSAPAGNGGDDHGKVDQRTSTPTWASPHRLMMPAAQRFPAEAT